MKKNKQGSMKKVAYGLLISGSVLSTSLLVNNQTQQAHAATNGDPDQNHQADQSVSTDSAAIQQQAVAIDANVSQAPNPDLTAASRPDTSTVSRPAAEATSFTDAVSAQAATEDTTATSQAVDEQATDATQANNETTNTEDQTNNDAQATDPTAASQVTINYVDASGNAIAAPSTITGQNGDAYNISVQNLYGYIYRQGSAQLNGTFGNGVNSVTLVYDRDPNSNQNTDSQIIIKYIDEATGKEIYDAQTITGQNGDPYDVTRDRFEINGYTFDQVTPGYTGFFGSTHEIRMLYKQNQNDVSQVIVHYVDENNQEISASVSLTGENGTAYDITRDRININGYTFDQVNPGYTGIFGTGAHDIYMRYHKDNNVNSDASQIIIHYVDDQGNEISAPVSITGKNGDGYDVSHNRINIDGYTFKEITPGYAGVFGNGVHQINFVYTKNTDVNPEGSQIIIHYVDENGNEIAAPVSITGKNGDGYDVSHNRINIDGYTFKEVNPGYVGLFGNGVHQINFVYTKDNNVNPEASQVIIHYVDENGKEIAAATSITGKNGDVYNVANEQLTIDGYTFKEVDPGYNGVFGDGIHQINFVYTKNEENSHIIIKYVDENGNTIRRADTMTGNVGDAYHVGQPYIDGYVYQYATDGLDGTYPEGSKTITLVYYSKAYLAGLGQNGNNQENNNGNHNSGNGNGIGNHNNGNNSNNTTTNTTNNGGSTTNNYYGSSNQGNGSNGNGSNANHGSSNRSSSGTAAIASRSAQRAAANPLATTASTSSNGVQTTGTTTSAKSLPKTGDNQESGLVALGLEAIGGMVGLAGYKARKKHEND